MKTIRSVAKSLPKPFFSPTIVLLALASGLGLSSCANTAWGDRLGQSLSIPTPLEADNPRSSEDANPTPITISSPPNADTISDNLAASPSPQPEPSRIVSDSPRPSPTFNLSPSPASSAPSPTIAGTTGANLDPTLQSAVEAVQALNVLDLNPTNGWEQPVPRRRFAQWLFAVNNRLYSDRPGQQIRPSSPTAQPIFQDIPATDPDFGVIQGLAEAGILPSPLRGNATATQFRPEATLTREELLLWKVPLDARQKLPETTIDRIEQTWNFQDANQINGEVLGAVLLDFENGELSNIRRVFGYTTLLQPQKPVTQAEAIAVLAYFGFQGQGIFAQDVTEASP